MAFLLNLRKIIVTLSALLLFAPATLAQPLPREPRPDDPCGYPDTTTLAYRLAALLNWGYGVDSLRADLARWSAVPFVRIDSVGESTQHRGLFMMTIQDTGRPLTPRKRVWIHARTHPNEVQGTWVTNEIIRQLLSGSMLAKSLRALCVFNILPMLNPDGVELKKPRENANGVDIESNWAIVPGENEVQVLRALFSSLMLEPNPILVALNMHSAYGNERYFVYHAATGTSAAYAAKEQQFIGGVRSYFPGGIQPWSFYVSWVSGPSTSYPESWFWQNHREAVLALTYEDKNSAAAGGFDTTANSILRGIGDFLGVTAPTGLTRESSAGNTAVQLSCYPNPFNAETSLSFRVSERGLVSLRVHDVLGREVATLIHEERSPGVYTVRFDGHALASGVYIARLLADGTALTTRLMMTK